MSVSVKSKTGSQNGRRINLIVISLIVVVLVVSLCVYVFVVDNYDVGPKHVGNETELLKVITTAKDNVPIVIIFDNDISLSDMLTIPTGKDITLTSNSEVEFFKLIGADYKDTLFVNGGGMLRIDGICVTHVVGDSGGGVTVDVGGSFVLLSGEISGNRGVWGVYKSSDMGGGVYNGWGTFEMYGGTIFNNEAKCGGGVYNAGTFSMVGGTILSNDASEDGGGVYNTGTFNQSGGEIYNNTANNGENVYEPQ